MENVFLSDTFWSAVKRKNLPDVLEIVFAQAGYEDASKVAHDTNAMTAAAMKRMQDAMGGMPETTEEVEESDKAIDPTELDYADEESDRLTVADIKALVASGKKKALKAAKKAFKAQFDKKHPEYKALKKLIKEA